MAHAAGAHDLYIAAISVAGPADRRSRRRSIGQEELRRMEMVEWRSLAGRYGAIERRRPSGSSRKFVAHSSLPSLLYHQIQSTETIQLEGVNHVLQRTSDVVAARLLKSDWLVEESEAPPHLPFSTVPYGTCILSARRLRPMTSLWLVSNVSLSALV